MNIFDEKGNPIAIEEVINFFIQKTAEDNSIDFEEIYVHIDEGFIKKERHICFVTLEDNGYDALETKNIGKEILVPSTSK